jgi:hypothetical protein
MKERCKNRTIIGNVGSVQNVTGITKENGNTAKNDRKDELAADKRR